MWCETCWTVVAPITDTYNYISNNPISILTNGKFFLQFICQNKYSWRKRLIYFGENKFENNIWHGKICLGCCPDNTTGDGKGECSFTDRFVTILSLCILLLIYLCMFIQDCLSRFWRTLSVRVLYCFLCGSVV